MPNTRAVTVALLLCLAVSAVAMAGGPFLGLGLEDALTSTGFAGSANWPPAIQAIALRVLGTRQESASKR